MIDTVPIESSDFWVKVVEMLQQNWARRLWRRHRHGKPASGALAAR